ncbi:MAG TPA: IS110 family transposase, partial [Bryobacteraceae bacterium]
AAYFGIVPRVSNSNETQHSGRITKRGTKLGRTTLIQCALIAQRFSPYLKTYYEKMKSRTLKNKWVFEDFPNFVLAEEAAA